MSRARVSLQLGFVLLLAGACGGDDDDDDDVIVPDAAAADAHVGPDAEPVPSAENLGQPCGGAGALQCPGGEACITVRDIGSTTEGFCTVACTGLDDTRSCSFEYAGPGEPKCVIDDGAGGFQCAIDCTAGGVCPTGLSCFDTGQAGVRLCAGDE